MPLAAYYWLRKNNFSHVELYNCAAVLPNYDQCLDAGKQTITADLGYINSVMPQRRGDRSAVGVGSSGGVAVLAHGHATTATSTSGLSALADSIPPCPIELIAEPGQRINFTLYDFAPRNLSYPHTASQVDYDDDALSKICHRSDATLLISHVAQLCYSVIGDKPFLWSKPKFDPP